jgi:hypothetical protein
VQPPAANDPAFGGERLRADRGRERGEDPVAQLKRERLPRQVGAHRQGPR